MSDPIPDKAQVSIDLPHKFYMGSFGRESRSAVTVPTLIPAFLLHPAIPPFGASEFILIAIVGVDRSCRD
jgi:hypothetical protein